MTTHTVESLMATFELCRVNRASIFDAEFKTALSEVFAALAEAKAFAETVGKDYVIATDNLVALQSKCDEQAREIERLTASEKDLQAQITAMCNAIANYDWNGSSIELIAKGFAERDTLQSKIAEQGAEIERLTFRCGLFKQMRNNQVDFVMESKRIADEAQAKVAAMEKQEPIGYVFDDGENIYTGSVIRRNQIDEYVPVYLAPGAAPKGKQA